MAMREDILTRAKALLADGTVTSVLGWKKGEFATDPAPAFFTTPEELDQSFTYDHFCGANLSLHLRGRKAADGKVLALLKPDDSYSFNQMLGENRVERDAVYILGIPDIGMLDPEKVRKAGIKALKSVTQKGDQFVFDTAQGEKTLPAKDVLLEKSLARKGDKHIVFDELLVEPKDANEENPYRFAGVEELEAMSPDERFAFWQRELSHCIRCNACRNACPVCGCVKCVFDNPASTIAGKANAEEFEEKMFHIIRAFHVAGRCTDCGECSRACPQSIPLHLLNRKFIKDINRIYGPFQSGENAEGISPLTEYKTGDIEPGEVFSYEGGK